MSTAVNHEIVLSELVNLRDLGGIPVSGGAIRAGRLLRSDDVSTIPATQAADLVDRGLRTVIDLRSPQEAAHTGRGPLGGHDVDYHSLPLTAKMAAPAALLAQAAKDGHTPEDVGRWYAMLVRNEAPSIVRGMRIIAEAPGAVLFHCAAGKDRTGVFAASILTVLGADPDDIVADYARTDDVMPAILARPASIMAALFAGGTERPGGTPGTGTRVAGQPAGALLAALAKTMRHMLATLEREPAGLVGVLSGAGLDDASLAELSRKLVTA